MQHQDKTKEQLMSEVMDLRRQVIDLQASDGQRLLTEESLRQELSFAELLRVVTAAAQQGTTLESVMQLCLEQICRHLSWPTGRVYKVTDHHFKESVPESHWYIVDPAQFEAFRQNIENAHFPKEQDLLNQ